MIAESPNDRRPCHHLLFMNKITHDTGSKITTISSKIPTMLSNKVGFVENNNVISSIKTNNKSGSIRQYFKIILFIREWPYSVVRHTKILL